MVLEFGGTSVRKEQWDTRWAKFGQKLELHIVQQDTKSYTFHTKPRTDFWANVKQPEYVNSCHHLHRHRLWSVPTSHWGLVERWLSIVLLRVCMQVFPATPWNLSGSKSWTKWKVMAVKLHVTTSSCPPQSYPQLHKPLYKSQKVAL